MAKTERYLQIAIGILLAAFVFVVFDTLNEHIVVVGDKAPDFNITSDSGKQITRSNFGGRVLVLNFWATWCPPCIEELPSLDELQRQMRSQGVVVVGVSVDKNEKQYKDFLKRARVSFETSRDPDASISAQYGTFKYPETYVINANGEVVAKYIGPKDWMSPEVINDMKKLL
jgi:cytochrome c biogenesis protein CcmG/thiol:disulfide interchange protein DsbE